MRKQRKQMLLKTTNMGATLYYKGRLPSFPKGIPEELDEIRSPTYLKTALHIQRIKRA